jgi:putative endonuclease
LSFLETLDQYSIKSNVFDGSGLAPCSSMSASRRFVYILKNTETPPRYYTGLTADVGSRLESHNAGRSVHTAKCRPWIIDVVVEFGDETRASAFERYLKSGSGAAFSRRHFR